MHFRIPGIDSNRETVEGEAENLQEFITAQCHADKMESLDFRRMNLRGIVFSGELRQCHFSGADLTDAVFNGCQLVGTNFTRASLCHAQLQNIHATACFVCAGADLYCAAFTDAFIEHGDFSSAALYRTDLTRAKLPQANFHLADLSDAILLHADLRLASFWYARFHRTLLHGAQLNWSDHDLLASVLLQEASSTGYNCPPADHKERMDAISQVQFYRDRCWKQFLSLAHPQTDWALRTLAKYLTPSDYIHEYAPKRLLHLGRELGRPAAAEQPAS